MKTGRFIRNTFISFLAMTFVCAPAMFGRQAVFAAGSEALEEESGIVTKVNDPYEKFNRAMFTFNDRLYFWVLKPGGTVYAAYFPPGFRKSVRNAARNWVFPARFVNSVFQGKFDKAQTETARFVINSTLGVAGLFDFAQTNFGLKPQDEDFGQTLAVWGAGSGPFLVVPVLGPSNPRDLLGYGVDSAMDPIFWLPIDWWISPSVKAGKILNEASLRIGEYEDFKKAALDPYISLRDAYIQYRDNEIKK